MRNIPARLPFSSARSAPAGGSIEWEELPSLSDTLAERLVVLGTRHRDALEAARGRAAAYEQAARSGSAWDETITADLEPQHEVRIDAAPRGPLTLDFGDAEAHPTRRARRA